MNIVEKVLFCLVEIRSHSQLVIAFMSVLVLVGVELILFKVASVGLCLGFLLKTLLITECCFRFCCAMFAQAQGLFCFSLYPISVETGNTPQAGRGHSWDS